MVKYCDCCERPVKRTKRSDDEHLDLCAHCYAFCQDSTTHDHEGEEVR